MSTTAAPTVPQAKAATETNVPLLDLKAQYATIRAEIEPVVREVIESQYFIGGPKVEQLEREIAVYCRADHAIGCANGSDAILIALQALDVGEGDEVLCPTYTFFATAGAVHRLGAKPVFADIDPATYNICPNSIREQLRRHPKVKALVPVHLFGQAADLDAILDIAKEKGLPVVEDAAQAIGTEDAHGIRVGSRGAIGTFSFFPSKNLGGFGDGGIITSNDKRLGDRMRRLRNHGMEPRYYHDEVGLNSRLDALQAAVLSVKLRHLDNWSAGRQRNAAFYDERFLAAGAKTSATPLSAGGFALRTPQPAPRGARHIYNQYVIRVPAAIRDQVRDELTRRKIGTEVYYPVPLHLQKCFAFLGSGPGSFVQSELAAKETIALPIYADLTAPQLEWVATSVIEAVRSLS
ncbi:MAG: DegT/DnrJ/EryC1/StrS family aminotransferase [Phycisphaerae bacterium]|jgi:dTDP-4-amino-4,6-dideoxygalactose transaminase|nr:DegT/DnrJ/EryC1/StrS family aminotransferase [Phycisphaerae bacterium]